MSQEPTPEASSEPPPPPPRHRDLSWIGAVVLILLGLVFLVQNLTGFRWGNWWALFILIPALYSFARTYQAYRAAGRLTREVTGPLVGGLVLTVIALIFLFDLDWGLLWPIFLIIGGLAILLSALGRPQT